MSTVDGFFKSKLGLCLLVLFSFCLQFAMNYFVMKYSLDYSFEFEFLFYVYIVSIPSIAVFVVAKNQARHFLNIVLSKRNIIDIFFYLSRYIVVIYLIIQLSYKIDEKVIGASITLSFFFGFPMSLFFCLWGLVSVLCILYIMLYIAVFLSKNFSMRIYETARGPIFVISAILSFFGLFMKLFFN